MSKRVAILISVALFGSFLSAPAAAARAPVERIEDFGTVLAVAAPEDFPIASLMRADCDFLTRVEQPDGSAVETMHCTLSDEPVMIPEFQGSPPSQAFRFGGGPCTWTSDYWWTVIGAPVYAESFSYVVTPSGQVQTRASYPAEPLTCD
jgi:hypothetical protein